MEVKKVCPFGGMCETARKDVMTRCHLYTKLMGKDPQTGKDIEEWACALAWLPTLLIENTRENKGSQLAFESFRNELTKTAMILSANIIGFTQGLPGLVNEIKRLRGENIIDIRPPNSTAQVSGSE